MKGKQMKRTTKLSVDECDQTFCIEIRHIVRNQTKDEVYQTHAKLVDKIHRAISELFYAQAIKCSRP